GLFRRMKRICGHVGAGWVYSHCYRELAAEVNWLAEQAEAAGATSVELLLENVRMKDENERLRRLVGRLEAEILTIYDEALRMRHLDRLWKPGGGDSDRASAAHVRRGQSCILVVGNSKRSNEEKPE